MELSCEVSLLILDISDVPSRVPAILVFLYDNILFVLNTDVLASLILESITNIFEHLEPSSVGLPDLHVS